MKTNAVMIIPGVLLVVSCLGVSACSRLPAAEPVNEAELMPLTEIPAAWGELVSVTFAPQADGSTKWRELWFANEETGDVTYVPAELPDWRYNPKLVRTLAGAAPQTTGGDS